MSKIERFEDIEAWKLARELCNKITVLSNNSKLEKDYGLRDQINRSSGSIMDNIAEGFERGGNKEFIRFLSIAKGSCGETRSQIYRCFDKKYINEQKFEELKNDCIVISSKIGNFIKYLKSSDFKGSKYKRE